MTTLRPPTFVDVLVPVALDHTYSYRVPSELELKPGDIVAVPLGAREVIGVVWADDINIRPGLHNRMKDVELKLDYPPVKPELRKFVDWVAKKDPDFTATTAKAEEAGSSWLEGSGTWPNSSTP